MGKSIESIRHEQHVQDAAAFRRMAKLAADPELAERLNRFADELDESPPGKPRSG